MTSIENKWNKWSTELHQFAPGSSHQWFVGEFGTVRRSVPEKENVVFVGKCKAPNEKPRRGTSLVRLHPISQSRITITITVTIAVTAFYSHGRGEAKKTHQEANFNENQEKQPAMKSSRKHNRYDRDNPPHLIRFRTDQIIARGIVSALRFLIDHILISFITEQR